MNARERWRELIGMVLWKRERELQTHAWAAARERDRAWWTGVWRSPWGARITTQVCWDPVLSRFFLREDVGDPWVYLPTARVRRYVMVLESAGYVPDADGSTDRVRSMLGLPARE